MVFGLGSENSLDSVFFGSVFNCRNINTRDKVATFQNAVYNIFCNPSPRSQCTRTICNSRVK
jgi:hypothetical protein